MHAAGRQLSEAESQRLARMVLAGIRREYPNQIAHALGSADDVGTPRELHPAFYGCYDWHSAVHGHWCLVRLLGLNLGGAATRDAQAVLAEHLTRQNLDAEAAYLQADGRLGFERPYGLAWLLQLDVELREWDDPTAGDLSATVVDALEPLAELATDRLGRWLAQLTHPIRSGEHSQTAFAMGLALDWARAVGHASFEELLITRAIDFHGADRDWRLAFEPSGHDFLSPSLAAADLMRRVLSPAQFADWLTRFLPELGDRETDFQPVACPNPGDGKLSHLDGLNLSRAWMLDGIGSGLPRVDSRLPAIRELADAHAWAGLAAVTGEHYEGGHWLASFAVYLQSNRGLSTRESVEETTPETGQHAESWPESQGAPTASEPNTDGSAQQPQLQLERRWLRGLLNVLIVLAIINGLTTIETVEFGIGITFISILVLAGYSYNRADISGRAWAQAWRVYLDAPPRGKRPVVVFPAPRFDLVTLMQTMLLSGVLLLVFRYLNQSRSHGDLTEWLLYAGYYLWLVACAVAGVLCAGRLFAGRWAGSPALAAGVGTTIGAAIAVVIVFVLTLVSTVGRTHVAEVLLFVIGGALNSMLAGLIVGAPLGALMDYWSNPLLRQYRPGRPASSLDLNAIQQAEDQP